MERRQKPGEELLPDKTDRDQALKEDLNMEVNIDDLVFDEEKNSYELDVQSEDPEYVHLDPYDTAVREYDKGLSLETDLDELGMHVDNGNIVEVLPIDEELSRTPEDDRDDLDEEGYPKNDRGV